MLTHHARDDDPRRSPPAADKNDASNHDTAEITAPSAPPREQTDARAGHAGVERPAIAGYEILGDGPVSAGGMGEIWKARRKEDGRAVAIKVPRPGSDEAMFRRESERLRRLDHPSIVKFLEAGDYAGAAGPRPYLVMEYVFDARPITRYAWENGLGLRQRLELFLELCAAVGYLHTANADGRGPHIHRDLKPANIQINVARPGTGKYGGAYWPLGRVKLIDLGLASPVEPEQAMIDRAWEQGAYGTPEYMSPEQYKPGAEGLDERSDIYALGVVLHELITGMLPYPASKQHGLAVRSAVINHEIERPATTARRMMSNGAEGVACPCEGDLEEIVLKALAARRADRFASVDAGAGELDLAENIRALLDSRPLPMKRGAAYRARMNVRRRLRHPAAWLIPLVMALAVGLTGPWWLAADSRVQTWWERSLIGLRTAAFERAPVLFVTYDENTDYAALARRAELAEAGDKASMRKVMGALLERLATAKPGVVLVDKWYGGPSDHDDAYLKGVEALREVDRSVVVVATDWFSRPREQVEAEISFAKAALWGTALMRGPVNWGWQVMAGQVEPAGDRVRPSLAAVGVMHYERGPDTLSYTFDAARDELVVRDASGEVRRLRMTGVVPSGDTSPQHDLRPETLVGSYGIDVPPDDVIAAKSIDMAALMELPDIEFNSLVSRKLIVVGDLGAKADWHPYPDGRIVPGPIAHGVAAGMMLLNEPITMPNHRGWEMARVAIAAVLGLAVAASGAMAARRMIAAGGAKAAWGVVVCAAPAMLAIAAMVWGAREAFASGGVMHSPVVYMATLAAAVIASIPLWISRVDRAWEQAGTSTEKHA